MYVKTKQQIPMDIDFMVSDTFEVGHLESESGAR